MFEKVYIDSEYTGRDVWNYILDSESGMGSDLVGCLKQNAFVKKQRDNFIFHNQNSEYFWHYWDDKHVYSNSTFTLKWDYKNQKTKKSNTMRLYCVVKRNINTGKLRCFGSSKNNSPKEILNDYSHRWTIENGIKDLIHSYFLDKCPGTIPNLVNVHFLIVSICKCLYRMIQRDTEDFIFNPDNTVKTLQKMRGILFKQGSAKIFVKSDTIEINFLNRFSPKLTDNLMNFYNKINGYGLKIIGGFKLKFNLLIPHGEEFKNMMRKQILDVRNFQANKNN